jgi:hypothetical protein
VERRRVRRLRPRKSERLSPSGGQLSGHAPLLRCGPGNGTMYSRTVAMRSLICASSSVSLARDPTGSPEGHQAWRIVAFSKERVYEVRVCCACVASLDGRSSEIRATGQLVVCDGVFCQVLAQVVSAGSALTVRFYSPDVLLVGLGRFTADYRSSSAILDVICGPIAVFRRRSRFPDAA